MTLFKTTRRRVLTGLAAASLLPTVALAQSWPERPVRVVVPYAAGGYTDTMARMTAEGLTKAFGQTFIVENKPGASGSIAAGEVARAAPDGYTLLFTPSPQILVVPEMRQAGYSRKDFVPISAFCSSANVLGVTPAYPANTLREFIDHAKANPGRFNYGSGGVGTFAHLVGALFLSRTELDMEHITYKGGAHVSTALMGGEIEMYFGNPSELLPLAESERIKLLAVSSAKPLPQKPELPRVSDVVPDFNLIVWQGLLAPTGTPAEIVEKLATAVAAHAQDPGVKQKLFTMGVEPIGNTPAEFARMIDSEQAIHLEALKAANVPLK